MKTQQKSLDLIQDEIKVMRTLQQMPQTRLDLEDAIGMQPRRARYVLWCLKEAGNIYCVAGTRIWALTDIERHGTG